MPSTNDEKRTALEVLQSIDERLKMLVGLFEQTQTQPTRVASNKDLDGKYGDPVLKVVPRDWIGEDFKGCHFSQCPADLLDLVAELFDYFAAQADEKNELTASGKPVSRYKRLDAARARGWARRNREHGPREPDRVEPLPAEAWADDDIPF